MKLLQAFIEASGFDVEVTQDRQECYKPCDLVDGKTKLGALPVNIQMNTAYKVTKREFNSNPTLHKIIREYEKYGMTASEMIGRIMLLEGISDKDL